MSVVLGELQVLALQAFADDPEEIGGEHPDGGGADYDQRRSMANDEFLYGYREDQESQASDRCSSGVDRHCFAGLNFTVNAGLLLSFSFVFFDKSRAGWENGRECEEQSAHDRAVHLRDNPRSGRDGTAEDETQQKLMPVRGLE